MDDVSPELKTFLDFVGKNKVADGDSFIKTLDEKIKEAKHNTKWRYEYMLLLTREDEKFAEGRAGGIKEANEATAVRMLKTGKLAMEEIASYSALSLATVQNLAKTVSLGKI